MANSLNVHLLNSLSDIQGWHSCLSLHAIQEPTLASWSIFKAVMSTIKSRLRPVLLLHDVNIIDYGDKNYDGATLTIDVSANPTHWAMSLESKQEMASKSIVQTGEIRYQNLLIGTIDAVENGKNGQALSIHFNANATEKGVESLMERLTYMNTSRNLVLGIGS